MKILLAALNSKFAHSNLAIRYLYHTVNKKYDIQLREYTINEELFRILSDIAEVKADVAAFSCYIWNIVYTLDLCRIIKTISPKTIIILGGPEVSHNTEELMRANTFIDYVVMGEGEETFPGLIDLIAEGRAVQIEGVALRDENGDIKIKGGPSVVSDLSLIPSPFHGDMTEYKQKAAYFESSRGCPYDCSYCLSSTTRGVRFFPMERVKADLLSLINAGAKQVKFVDRTFNCNKERAMEIWRFLLDNRGETTFHFEISGHLLDDEQIELLSQAPDGYFQFEIGVQSTYQKTIEAVNRKTDFERLKNITDKLRRNGNIHLHLDLIAGLPYETYERFSESFDDVYDLNPHMLQLGFLKLLKGSRIRQERSKHSYKFLDKPPYEVLENSYISFDELIKLKRIEEVLEVYKNSGRFESSLYFILKNHYKSPFKFYEDLSGYWYAIKAFERKIGIEEAFDIFADFYSLKIRKMKEQFLEILKFDYTMSHPGGRKRPWQKKYSIENFKGIMVKALNDEHLINEHAPQLSGKSVGDKLKSIHFEVFGFDVISPDIPGNPVIIGFIYREKSSHYKKTNCFKLPENLLEGNKLVEM